MEASKENQQHRLYIEKQYQTLLSLFQRLEYVEKSIKALSTVKETRIISQLSNDLYSTGIRKNDDNFLISVGGEYFVEMDENSTLEYINRRKLNLNKKKILLEDFLKVN
eukprot:GHVP01000136.1.p1 GENE.GHVP01000136.1~~GHVP01000136.1.p1  ORF type:complete len:109 (+),score=22.46 GHVP01000136.1:362-688(+)